MGTVRIPLHSRKYPGLSALVDEADVDLVNRYRWHPDPNKNGRIYAKAEIRVDGKRKIVRMHRFILGITDPIVQVDHVNQDGLDNQRENIRVATHQQNNFNRSKAEDRQFKGVSFHREHQKWYAQIYKNKQNHFLGYFATPVEAARAYDAAAIELFGQFAFLNFPDDTNKDIA